MSPNFWGCRCCGPPPPTVGCDDGCDMLVIDPNLVSDAYVETVGTTSTGSVSGNLMEWIFTEDLAEGIHIVHNDEVYDNPSCTDIQICIDREWTIILGVTNHFICLTIYQDGEHYAYRLGDGSFGYGCIYAPPGGMTSCGMTFTVTSSNFRKIAYTSTTLSFSTGNPDFSQPFQIGLICKVRNVGVDVEAGTTLLEMGSICVVCT